jgi:hypothetical protein
MVIDKFVYNVSRNTKTFYVEIMKLINKVIYKGVTSVQAEVMFGHIELYNSDGELINDLEHFLNYAFLDDALFIKVGGYSLDSFEEWCNEELEKDYKVKNDLINSTLAKWQIAKEMRNYNGQDCFHALNVIKKYKICTD